jgi:hypothetical protein
MGAGDKPNRVMASPHLHSIRRPIRSRRSQKLHNELRGTPERPIRWSDHPDLVLRRLGQLYGRGWQ